MSLPTKPILLARLALRPSLFAPWTLLAAAVAQQAQRHASILSRISDNAGAYKKKIRRGRGPASGKGKTSGRGHKGQGQHGKGPPVGFQGGQTPEHIVKGPRGFENVFSKDMTALNLDRLQSWIDQGRINPSRPITLVQLYESGCVNSIGDGIKLLARGKEVLRTPVHIIVSQASREAIAAVEAAGGTITTRYYTKPAIDNVLAGRSHPIHSRLFRPTPITELASSPHAEYQYELPDPAKRKVLEYYRDAAHRGYLSYQVPLGHSPSLYFKTPGTVLRSSKKEKEERLVENRLW